MTPRKQQMDERLKPVIKAMRFRLEEACGADREQLDELDQHFFDTAAECGAVVAVLDAEAELTGQPLTPSLAAAHARASKFYVASLKGLGIYDYAAAN
jgi:hypothetical protein